MVETTCPCCRQPVAVPPITELIERLDEHAHAVAVLEAVWAARGLPVTATALFDTIYADDPDGGPSTARMYRDLRAAVATLNERLGRHVIVIHDGRAKGWRLKLPNANAV